MSSHVLPPPVPDLEEVEVRPKLWVIEEEELDISAVSEDGSSLTSEDIRTRYVDPTSLDAAAALCGVPTGDSISRGSFSPAARDDARVLGEIFEDNSTSTRGHYGESGSNLLRESNRVNTAQMVASVQFVRRRRMQNMILAGSAVASLLVAITLIVA